MRRAAAGFTLIEIAVVLLLLSLLFGTALSNMQGMVPASATEATARELIGQLDFARTQAVASGRSFAVVLDLEEQRYAIRTPFDADGRPTEDPDAQRLLPWRKVGEGTVLEAVLDATGTRRERGVLEIPFHPAGDSADFWAYVTHVAQKDAHRVTIRVLGLTGLSSLIQGEVEPEVLGEADF